MLRTVNANISPTAYWLSVVHRRVRTISFRRRTCRTASSTSPSLAPQRLIMRTAVGSLAPWSMVAKLTIASPIVAQLRSGVVPGISSQSTRVLYAALTRMASVLPTSVPTASRSCFLRASRMVASNSAGDPYRRSGGMSATDLPTPQSTINEQGDSRHAVTGVPCARPVATASMPNTATATQSLNGVT